MQFHEIEKVVTEILRDQTPAFLTSYQVFQAMQDDYPELAERIVTAYGSDKDGKIGSGAGKNYSPASFVGKALDYFAKQNKLPIRRDYLVSRDVTFGGVQPGEKGGWTAIYAWYETKTPTEKDFVRAFMSQQRHTDDVIADIRRYYETWDPEQRAEIRAYIQKVKEASSGGSDYGLLVNIHVVHDEYPEDEQTYDEGHVLWSVNAHTWPSIMLQAIWAWDYGEEYTPPGALPS